MAAVWEKFRRDFQVEKELDRRPPDSQVMLARQRRTWHARTGGGPLPPKPRELPPAKVPAPAQALPASAITPANLSGGRQSYAAWRNPFARFVRVADLSIGDRAHAFFIHLTRA